MKKKLLALCLVLMLFITGCAYEGICNYEKNSPLRQIKTMENLYYHTDTKVIYIVFCEFSGNQGYGYMATYYSENGKLCRYVDREIVEIVD